MTNGHDGFGGAVGGDETDAAFVLISAFIVFTMQTGFAFFESGLVSRRSQVNIMMKCVLDVSLGGVAYWLVGYGFSYGPNSSASKAFSGNGLFLTEVDVNGKEAYRYFHFFFQLAFATTATTIVSGAVAERVRLGGYMIFAIVNAAFIYVFPCHWIWSSDGWMFGHVHDFAGSVVVHMSGGAASIAACIVLQPRRGRYTEDQKFFAMASPTNVILGTFFLWWGWIGFNCGSQFHISGDDWGVVGRIAVVTMLGAMGGSGAAVLINLVTYKWRSEKYLLNVEQFTAGLLGGLVSITAGCNVIAPWEGLLIGFIGGAISIAVIEIVDKLHIDDPVGAIGVHWGGGFWAMIATGLFASQPTDATSGVFHGGNGQLLGWNILAGLVVTLWSAGTTAILFLILKFTLGIRLTDEEELKGSDAVEHGVAPEYSSEDYYSIFQLQVKPENEETTLSERKHLYGAFNNAAEDAP